MMTMASGGSRNRSGPQSDPNSLRSAERGVVLTALPAAGYTGDVPGFPLPPRITETDSEELEATGERIHNRELDLWAWAWTTPQACAWALEPWRWPIVAMWVRTYVVCEGADATAADKGSLHRFADQIGMTPAGLKENGWAIAKDQPAPSKAPTRKRAAKKTTTRAPSARDRMKVLPGGRG